MIERFVRKLNDIAHKGSIRMTESMKYYESIRRKYPETVSQDQFYQIAHISKPTKMVS